jgi:CheY-like chemotaxis protein
VDVVAPHAAQTPLLFVDDDEAIVKMFSAFFTKKGYPVAIAHDGVEAMQQLTTARFEVVIADLNMPRLDGWGLLKALREDFRTQELLVALFSAHDDYREQLRAMHAGAQAYYSKGLKLNALELQVRELGEPRRRFKRLLEQQQSVTQSLSSLGPQWIVRCVAASGQSVQLDAVDGWSAWRLSFSRGQLIRATARTGSQTFASLVAVKAFLCSRTLEGSIAFVEPPGPPEFPGMSAEQVLQRAVAELNDEQRRARDELLRSAQTLEVNAELHHLYVSVGPPAWQPIVKALCEDRMLPRDVMARLQVTPQEMGAVLKDLLRRGVVTLTP